MGITVSAVDARAVGSQAAGGSGPFSVVVLPADAPAALRQIPIEPVSSAG